MPARAVSLKAASVHGTIVIVRNYLCALISEDWDKVQQNFSFFFLFENSYKRERLREGANTSNTQKSLSPNKVFLLFFQSSHHPPLSLSVCVCSKLMLTFRTPTHAEVDNRTLSCSRFFVFNANKKLLGTCLRLHLCVYYALQWFSVYVIQRARRALSLSLSLSFRVVI